MVINAPRDDYKSIEEVLDAGLKAEQDVTNNINDIYEATVKNSDYASKVFIKWFIAEQFKEESEAQKMIDDYKLFNDNLYELDKKYLGREHKKVVL